MRTCKTSANADLQDISQCGPARHQPMRTCKTSANADLQDISQCGPARHQPMRTCKTSANGDLQDISQCGPARHQPMRTCKNAQVYYEQTVGLRRQYIPHDSVSRDWKVDPLASMDLKAVNRSNKRTSHVINDIINSAD